MSNATLALKPLCEASSDYDAHWLECFAMRMADGSVEATCRLDNKDWRPGQRLLAADCRAWPGTTESMHSRRQFLLLLPQGGVTEPEPAGFWARLLGRG